MWTEDKQMTLESILVTMPQKHRQGVGRAQVGGGREGTAQVGGAERDFFWFGLVKTGFLWVALAILELTL